MILMSMFNGVKSFFNKRIEREFWIAVYVGYKDTFIFRDEGRTFNFPINAGKLYPIMISTDCFGMVDDLKSLVIDTLNKGWGSYCDWKNKKIKLFSKQFSLNPLYDSVIYPVYVELDKDFFEALILGQGLQPISKQNVLLYKDTNLFFDILIKEKGLFEEDKSQLTI